MLGWLFMRVSGVVLVVLIFGHLFVNLMVGEGIHAIDFAFVAGKWADPFWQVWDLAMLWLAMLHGTNGMRTIINDYAEKDSTRLWLKIVLYCGHRRHHRPRHPGDLHLRPVPRGQRRPAAGRFLPRAVRRLRNGSPPARRRQDIHEISPDRLRRPVFYSEF